MRRSLIAAVISVAVAVAGAVPAAAAAPEGVSSQWTDAQRRAHGLKVRGAAKDDTSLLTSSRALTKARSVAPLGDAAPATVTWPSAGTAHLDTQAGRTATATPGGLRVAATPVGPEAALSTRRTDQSEVSSGVDVQVLDHARATAAGVDGVVLAVTGSAGSSTDLSLGYAGFAGAYGGDWASRLRLVQLPACALSDPSNPDCRTQTPIDSSVNDPAAQAVSARQVSSGAVLALTAGTSGGSGSWSATPLSASASWQVNKQVGDFSWSYPLTVPVTQGGPTPSVSLTYDAGSLDGRIATTNNQSSWVGDGWDLGAGYVERKYVACAEDATGNANNVGHPTGDLCWGSDNATLVLAGHSSELVKDAATGSWRLKDDDGTAVRHLTGSWNGDNDTEYWQVTTTDGTQYWFGRDKRSASDPLALSSAWTVPVYGNNPGEPCHAATFAASVCTQAWRWNLDYVVDPSGNSMTYVYSTETNSYGRDNNSAVSSYVRGGYLSRIDYGQRAGSETSAPAPQQLSFTVAERCLPSGAITCDPAQLTAANASSWPDVPFDLICTSTTSCPTLTSPAFFTRKRLTQVSTAVSTSGGYRTVDSWALTQKFPSPGDGSNPVLWLDSIQHTGAAPWSPAGAPAGTSVTLPKVTFTGVQLANRVDTSGNLGPAMIRWRISSITSETGAITSVNYTAADCTTASLPGSADSNTRRCFPVVWSPEGLAQPVTEYFHKYLVSSVVQDSLDAQSLPVETRYTYVGDPAWHYDDSPLTPPAQRTWGQFRGYETVDVTTGSTTSAQLHTRHRYLRGMHGDHLSSGGTRSVTVDGIVDVPRVNGFEIEQITYDGATVVQDETHVPWVSPATATAADGTTATFSGTASSQTTTPAPALAGGSRTTRTATSFDATYGTPSQIDDQGDISTSADDRCTRLDYARNTTANIVGTVREAETVSVACSAGPSRPGDVVSDERTLYDGGTFGTAPTRGLVTGTQVLSGYNGSTPTFVTTSTATYDANGRVTSRADALGNTTTTAYTPASGGPTTSVTVTSPDPDGTGSLTAHQVTTALEPARGQVASVTDANGKVTSAAYDGLGRRTAVWLPGRALTAGATTTYDYAVGGTASSGLSTVTTKTLSQDGTYLTSVSFYDALDRPRQTQSMGANRDVTATLVTDTLYDSRGLAVTVNDQWATAGSPSTTLLQPSNAVPSRTRYTYDGAGRVTAAAYDVDQQQKWVTTTTYGGDRTTVVPPNGSTPTTTILDGRGQTTSLVRYTTATLSGPSQVSTYGYDKAGRLTSTTDSTGNTWTSTYDIRGRLTASTDPDKGASSATYDDADRTVTSTDARGVTLWFGYDALGRRTAERTGTSTGALQATWTYDTIAKGQLTSSTRYEAGNLYTTAVIGYDDAYQPTGQSVTLPSSEGKLAGTYTTSYGYTLDEQVKTQTMPALANLPSETYTTYYDKLSRPEWSSGGLGKGVYVAGSGYSSFGDLLSLDLGNSYSDYLSYTYEQGTRRLSTQRFEREKVTGSDLALTYTYDEAGNVTKVADAPTAASAAADTQCFTYDGLQRLTSAWTPSAGDCGTAATVAGLGGAAPYWTDYAYDTNGLRTSTVTHAGAGTTTSTYTYPTAGTAKAHTLTGVTTTGPSGTATSSYAYDQAGNTTTRAPAGQAAQTLTWNAEGKLATVSAAGTQLEANIYTPDGDRLIRRAGTKVTAYLPGGQELTLDTGTQALSAVRYYAFAGTTIAMRTGTGFAGVTTLVPDTQGTALESIANTTNVATRRWADPFGGSRGTATGTWTGDHGFLDKATDTTGLTAVGARFYDPVIGRFISVDPVMNGSDPQQWAAYTYSDNNPVTWSDPSGLLSWGSAWNSTKSWVVKHQAQIVGAVAGIVVTAGCLAVTAGAGSIACAAAGGAAASAVTNLWASKVAHTQTFSWKSLAIDTAVGAVVGAATGALGKVAAPLLSKAGTAIANAARTAASRAAPAARQAAATVTRAASNTARAALRTESSEGSSAAASAAKACSVNSFTGATLVTMADGAKKPIRAVKVGDKVLATDPATGQTAARPVTKLIVHAGKHTMVDVHLADGTTITATDRHPFWDATTGQFTYAIDLHPGDQVRQTDGTPLTIQTTRVYDADLTAYNLTVDDIHTYYAGTTPVLVHNSCFGEAAEAAAGTRPAAGQAIYRVYGGDSVAGGASWSPVNPGTVPNFRSAAGLPSGGASGATNTGRFVIEGTLNDPAAVVLQRSALPLDGMKGGLPEYIVPNWMENGSITIRRVSGANPEF
ncbi:polymorphic toxin-type HINT domain-containing protein [Cellulomonas citrea]|uniref:polymorphic toxin-type HINT domain-containing protein n=1 Tax=Cellulomonas citrea TaxID=1909423 RepID=UPI001359F5FB|nr:polymorphic toxin-type HINT domain-containing protein [Cellulomonas citrea]